MTRKIVKESLEHRVVALIEQARQKVAATVNVA